jgi:hypothetical protein
MALSSYTHGYLAQLTKQLTDIANTLREVGKDVATQSRDMITDRTALAHQGASPCG